MLWCLFCLLVLVGRGQTCCQLLCGNHVWLFPVLWQLFFFVCLGGGDICVCFLSFCVWNPLLCSFIFGRAGASASRVAYLNHLSSSLWLLWTRAPLSLPNPKCVTQISILVCLFYWFVLMWILRCQNKIRKLLTGAKSLSDSTLLIQGRASWNQEENRACFNECTKIKATTALSFHKRK